MNVRREVPPEYSNALKNSIRTIIEGRTNINSERKQRSFGALNKLFIKKPALRPPPENNNNNSTEWFSGAPVKQANTSRENGYKEYLRSMGNY